MHSMLWDKKNIANSIRTLHRIQLDEYCISLVAARALVAITKGMCVHNKKKKVNGKCAREIE